MGYMMLGNYLAVALRNLRRFKIYALINIAGLALATALCILLFLGVHNEWNHDNFHQFADKIYRVVMLKTASNDANPQTVEPEKVGTHPHWKLIPSFLDENPAIEHVVQIRQIQSSLLQYRDRIFDEKGIFASPAFFDMFTFPLLQGNPHQALKAPRAIVLSQELAAKYFAQDNPIGKRLVLRMEDQVRDLVVTGIMQTIPANSSMKFSFVLSLPTDSYWNRVYIQARETFQKDALRHFDLVQEEWLFSLDLLPLTAVHRFDFSGQVLGVTYFLSSIGLITLLMACANFINLSIGLSTSRGKEVGIRKTLGAQRGQLIGQYWVETMVLSLIGLGLGMVLAEAFMPAFNKLLGKSLDTQYALQYNWPNLLFLVGLLLFTGLAAGSYPALVLSGYHPVAALRNRITIGKGGWFGKGLVVFQFAMSTVFVIWMLFEYKWAYQTTQKDLGFDQKEIVVVPLHMVDTTKQNQHISRKTIAILRSELGRQEEIINITGTSLLGPMGPRLPMDSFVINDQRVIFDVGQIDAAFIKTLEVELIKGENFSRDAPANAVLINQSMERLLQLHMGWTSVLGKSLPLVGDPLIIGVVKNFHHYIDSPIRPLLMSAEAGSPVNNAYIKISPNNIPLTLELLREAWDKTAPDLPFQYTFLDELIETEQNERMGMIGFLMSCSLFSIAIAGLGVLGLTSLAVSRRTKEIGIRKILGATLSNIVWLLSKEFVWLIAISFLVAGPLAYLLLLSALQNNGVIVKEFDVWTFVLGGGIVLAMALLIASLQSVKAAGAAPVDALREE